jgi:hypothetical protein
MPGSPATHRRGCSKLHPVPNTHSGGSG